MLFKKRMISDPVLGELTYRAGVWQGTFPLPGIPTPVGLCIRAPKRTTTMEQERHIAEQLGQRYHELLSQALPSMLQEYLHTRQCDIDAGNFIPQKRSTFRVPETLDDLKDLVSLFSIDFDCRSDFFNGEFSLALDVTWEDDHNPHYFAAWYKKFVFTEVCLDG